MIARRLAAMATLAYALLLACKTPGNPYGPTNPDTRPPPDDTLPPPMPGTSWVGWTPTSGVSGVQDPNGYCGVMRIEPSMRADGGLTKAPLATVRDLNSVIYDAYHWRNSDGAQVKIYQDRDDPSLFWVNIAGSTVKRTLPGSIFLNHDINSLGENAYSQNDLFGGSAYAEFVRSTLVDALTNEKGFIKRSGVKNPKLVLMGHSQGGNVASLIAWQAATGLETEPLPKEASDGLSAGGTLKPRPATITPVKKLRDAMATAGAQIVGGVGTASRPLGYLVAQNLGHRGLGNAWVFEATSRRELPTGRQLASTPGTDLKVSDLLDKDKLELLRKAAPEVAQYFDESTPVVQIVAVQGLENDDPVPLLGTPGMLTTAKADADAGWMDLVRGPTQVATGIREAVGGVGDAVGGNLVDRLGSPFKVYKAYTDIREGLNGTIAGLRMALLTNRVYVSLRSLVYFPDADRTFVDAHGGSYIDGKLGVGSYLAAHPPSAGSKDAYLASRPVLERDVAQATYGATRTLHVLANDWDALGRKLVLASAKAKLGKVTVATDGRSLVYTAPTEAEFSAARPGAPTGATTDPTFAAAPDDEISYVVRYESCDPAKDLGPGGSCATPPTFDAPPAAIDLVHEGENGLFAKGPFYSPEPPSPQTIHDAAKLRVFPKDAPLVHYLPGPARPAVCASDADCHGGTCDVASGACRNGTVGMTYVGGYGFDCRKAHVYEEKEHKIEYQVKTKGPDGKEQEIKGSVDICNRGWYKAFDLSRNAKGDAANALDNAKVAAIEDAFDAEDFRGPDGVPDTLWVEPDPEKDPKGDKRAPNYLGIEADVHTWTVLGADQTKWDQPPPTGGNMGLVRVLNRAFVKCATTKSCTDLYTPVATTGSCPTVGTAIDYDKLRSEMKGVVGANPLRVGVEVPTVVGGACYGFFAEAKVPIPCSATTGWTVEMKPIGGAATPVYVYLAPGASQWSWAGQYTSDGLDALVGSAVNSLVSTGSSNDPKGICASAREFGAQKLLAFPYGKYTPEEMVTLGLPATHACYDVLHFTVGGPFTPGCSVSTAKGSLLLVLQSTCSG